MFQVQSDEIRRKKETRARINVRNDWGENQAIWQDRMKSIGAWVEARIRYATRLADFKAKNFGARQAAIVAFREVSREFPPPAEFETSPILDADLFANNVVVSEDDAIRWVADHLVVKVGVRECPNARCWSLLMWARADRDSFYKNLYPRLLSKPMLARGDEGRDRGEVQSPDTRLMEYVDKNPDVMLTGNG